MDVCSFLLKLYVLLANKSNKWEFDKLSITLNKSFWINFGTYEPFSWEKFMILLFSEYLINLKLLNKWDEFDKLSITLIDYCWFSFSSIEPKTKLS